MNKVYLKSSFKEIKDSKGKFISIILIILLGTMIFVGVRATGPDLSYSASTYVNDYHLADLQIISTMGLTEDDLQVLNNEKGVTTEAGHSIIFEKSKDEIVQVQSYSSESELNQLRVIEGQLPKAANELVLDVKAKEVGYQLGEEYLLDSDSLEREAFKIVGFVNSPLYISTIERGATNSGNGKVNYFIYLPEENFSQDIYSVMNIRFTNTKDLIANSSEYKDVIEENKEWVEGLFANRAEERLDEIQEEARQTIYPHLEEIQLGKEQIAAAKLQPGIDLAPLLEEEKKLVGAEEELNAQLMEIDELEKPVYFFHTRSANPGYQGYFDTAVSIAAIAVIFPAFFLFIAVLVTFTTMSRMVEENRGEIGTLKALGYTKFEIAQKYIIYTLLAGLLGVGLGTVIGSKTLPLFIFHILKDHNIPNFVGQYHWSYILQSLAAGLFATLGSAMYVLWKDLKEKPATLMRPRAPKVGKRIFLERITPLWNRLSFNQKVSYRNLFRYKSRMIMAVVGIAGCTGLILTGYGIKNSTGDLEPKQFNEILQYQGIVTMADDEVLDHHSQITDQMKADVESLSMEGEEGHSQTVSMVTPADTNNFHGYVTLQDAKDGEDLPLSDAGILITEKLAQDLDVEAGDRLYVKRDNKKIEFIVSGVVKNYAGHFAYVTPAYYEEIFEIPYEPTSILIKTKTMSSQEQQELTSSILEQADVMNVSFFQEGDGGESQFGSLNSVVVILIVVSGVLALVVLYNLTNINISERIRELSTIKVLGFYNKEVTAYVMRENIVLTLFGIVLGFVIGVFLHRFILTTADSGSVVFPLDIHWESFVYSGLITMVFSLLVTGIAHFKLKNINMIDALKSNE